jgi:uncharacterized membrane protein YqjE
MDEKDLSTVELVKQITHQVGELARKQIELAKTELRADVRAEAGTVGGLAAAAAAGLITLTLLLVTLIFALSLRLPGWAAGLIVSGFTLGVALIIGLVSWSRRVRTPLERTRRSLKEDIKFTKERLA